MRVHVVDPSAYTPPYDHALCAALARAGADVELITSRFAYGPAPAPQGYRRRELFYRRSSRRGGDLGGRDRDSRLRLALKLGEHVPDMLRYRRLARAADVIHFQWLTVQPLDVHLLPSGRSRVITAHDVLPREPRPGQLASQRRLYERMDAVVVHSDRGRRRLIEELGVVPERVHVIPHGPLTDLLEADDSDARLPAELTDSGSPVVLCFGLMRPYKGIDVLLEAWREIEHAQLWIVGMPRMDIAPLRAAAPAGVSFVPRFVGAGEAAACLRRADLVVLPYRESDQSGVLFTALAFGSALVVSDVGGLGDLAALGAARLVSPGDAGALHEALVELLGDPPARARLAAAARAAGGGPYSWEQIARRTLELYSDLGAGP